MAQVFNQRSAYYGMILVVAAIVLVVVLVRSCDSGLRIEGDAKNRVESVTQNPDLEAREFPALVDHLGHPASPKSAAFFDLDCSQIVHDDIAHLLYTDGTDCPTLVLPDAMGFDVIANYWDAACPRPPTLVAQDIDGKTALTVDTTRNRGTCEEIAIQPALGITLKP